LWVKARLFRFTLDAVLLAHFAATEGPGTPVGLPRYVERDFAKYLECGVLAHGFARVRCESCKDELLVAFSCKGRGVCPSCNAKRAHVTAVHLVERKHPIQPRVSAIKKRGTVAA